MYTKNERKAAAKIIRQIALVHHVTEEEVRRDIEAAICAARANPDPQIQARWAMLCGSRKKLSAEEFILWVAQQL